MGRRAVPPGRIAALSELADPGADATVFGEFLAALHTSAPVEAPVNSYRGVPPAGRAKGVSAGPARIDPADRPAAPRTWEAAAAVPGWDGPPLWLHGSLPSADIPVDRGRIGFVIDFDDLTGGDPTTDLSVAWTLFTADT
ncbi:phosphotransferase [Kitasatospora griseola]|uniref:phosphotransferase n=1 Tax=Kitasatospora griseola TaxID=2064 RepID=UPI00343A2F9E